jgi:hypothetical protein
VTVDLGTWAPLTPRDVCALFIGVEDQVSWWIAGGYAIELFVGRPLREHGDIDVLMLRRDQHRIHDVLDGWDIHAAGPPGQLRRWPSGETLPEAVHDIWCRETPDGPWRFQVMLDESDGTLWRSRVNSQVCLPVPLLGRRTAIRGWPYLTPEVQLFYKARHTRAKDEMDFAAAAPLLDERARSWLDDALRRTVPEHHWRTALRTSSSD